jgi:hypothetical protein
MNVGALLAANGGAVVAVLALGWAILRYEAERYAKLHPHSPVVEDVERAVGAARAMAAAMGLTPESAAHWLAGYLSGKGLAVSAAQITSGMAAVQKQAAADTTAMASPAAAAGKG